MANKAAQQAAKGQTLPQLRQENFELRRILSMVKPQAEQAMMQAAESQGRYLHMLKLFSALIIQNMAAGIDTVVKHKTLVDLPETLNIGRDEFKVGDEEIGYIYKMLTDAEVQAKQKEFEAKHAAADTERPADGDKPLVVPATS